MINNMLTYDYFKNKSYSTPDGINNRSSYISIIDKGYAKYLEIIYYCGGVATFEQFSKLLALYDKKDCSENSLKTLRHRIVTELVDLKFIKVKRTNKNKYIYLAKPSYNLVLGTVKHNSKVCVGTDIKNNGFKNDLIRLEYFLSNKVIVNAHSTLNQLRFISSYILDEISKNNYAEHFDMDTICQLSKCTSINEGISLCSQYKPSTNKIGILRDIWLQLGNLYKGFLRRNNTVIPLPEILHISFTKLPKGSKRSVDYSLKLVTTLVINDVDHDMDFYRYKIADLTQCFNKIEGNFTANIAKKYAESRNVDFGDSNLSLIGFKLHILGFIEKMVAEKVYTLNQEFSYEQNPKVTNVSCLLGVITAETFDIEKYFVHDFDNNEHRLKNDIRTDEDIKLQLSTIRRPNRKQADFLED